MTMRRAAEAPVAESGVESILEAVDLQLGKVKAAATNNHAHLRVPAHADGVSPFGGCLPSPHPSGSLGRLLTLGAREATSSRPKKSS